jgi:RND family efflux transporter MFP subunit
MSYRKSLPVLLLSLAAAVGCNRAPAESKQQKPPEVDVATPVADTIRDFDVFTGRTQAINNVDLRARVTGYLDKVNFNEGDDVEEGRPLFILKQEPFQYALRQAKASLAQQQAQLAYNDIDYQRAVNLRERGANSPDDVQKALAARDSLQGAVANAQAAVDVAQQNLDWATIKAPFTGRISRRLVDPGNDVMADNTVLANIVQVDPLYAYFDVDERTLLHIRSLLPEGKIPAEALETLPLTLGLANEKPEDFKHTGKLKFADNRVDPGTGTLRMWGTFQNPKRDLYPGLFIRVRMGLGKPRPALFVAEAALGSDQGRKYLYAVDDDNKIVRVPVEVGQRKNGRIAVESGLKGGERIVVTGLQNVRPKMEVAPKLLAEMPHVQTPSTKLTTGY